MAAETSLFSPSASNKQGTSSIRSIISSKSTSSKASTASNKSMYCDLLGVRTKDKDSSNDTSSSRLSSAGSIASQATASSTSSNASTATKTSSKSSLSLTEHGLFGNKLPPTEEELAPSVPNAVELEGGKFKVPEPIDKQFFKDLTCLEDEELIKKYGLIQVKEEVDEDDDDEPEKKKKDGKLKRMLRNCRHEVIEMV